MTNRSTAEPRGGALAGVAAVGSVVLATACCSPLLPFAAAAGLATGSTFLELARPYLLGASLLFIGYGFYQARRARHCRRKPSALAAVLLWLSTIFVTLSIFFPDVMANAAASLADRMK